MQLTSFNATVPRFGSQRALPPGPSGPETQLNPPIRLEGDTMVFDVSQVRKIAFKDGDKTLASIGAGPDGGFVRVKHPTNSSDAWLGMDQQGYAMLDISNPQGKQAVTATTTAAGGGLLSLRNPEGEIALIQGYDPTHKGGVSSYHNVFGKQVVTIGAVDAGAGKIQLLQANGEEGSGLNAHGQTLRIR